jgi:hypothetical protein
VWANLLVFGGLIGVTLILAVLAAWLLAIRYTLLVEFNIPEDGFRPFGAVLFCFQLEPTAYAVGFILALLRRWELLVLFHRNFGKWILTQRNVWWAIASE